MPEKTRGLCKTSSPTHADQPWPWGLLSEEATRRHLLAGKSSTAAPTAFTPPEGTSHVPSPSLVLPNRSPPCSPSIPHSQDFPKLKECRQVFRTLGKDVVPGARRTDSPNRLPEPNQLHLAFDWCQRGTDIWPPGRTPSEQTAWGGGAVSKAKPE